MLFPLLSLPDLALEEIVKNFDHKEILFLTQTSQKARRQISKHKKSHSVEIKVTDFDVEISCNNRKFFRIQIKTWGREFNSSWRFKTLVPVQYQESTLTCFWRLEFTAFQEILDFLKEIFQIKEVSLKVIEERSSWVAPILEHCVSKNLKIGSVEWSPIKKNEEMVDRLLMASRGASWLKIRGLQFAPIRFNHFHLFRVDQLSILYAIWMTAENILALRNCKRLDLGFIRLNAVDMNRILREYIKNPGNLQEIRLTCYECLELDEVVKDLKIVGIEGGDNPKYWFAGQNGIRISAMMESIRTLLITRET
uniref:F-box domain-containing protein n=1 Tax=Caenorhabditis tropicalis TaxID=1561998 RepID=A0A1I7UT74_9PELO